MSAVRRRHGGWSLKRSVVSSSEQFASSRNRDAQRNGTRVRDLFWDGLRSLVEFPVLCSPTLGTNIGTVRLGIRIASEADVRADGLVGPRQEFQALPSHFIHGGSADRASQDTSVQILRTLRGNRLVRLLSKNQAFESRTDVARSHRRERRRGKDACPHQRQRLRTRIKGIGPTRVNLAAEVTSTPVTWAAP